MGRPTKFKEEYKKQVVTLCRLGATDQDLAEAFDVTEQTINNWKEKEPEFFESLKKGKEIYDEEVEESLRKRALGFKRTVEKVTKLGIVEVKEEVPPDTTAGIFWLKNRKPKEWRDKQEHEHSGAVAFTPVLEISEDDPS